MLSEFGGVQILFFSSDSVRSYTVLSGIILAMLIFGTALDLGLIDDFGCQTSKVILSSVKKVSAIVGKYLLPPACDDNRSKFF